MSNTRRTSAVRTLLYSIIIIGALCLPAGLGFWAGQYALIKRFDTLISTVEQSESLAGVLSQTPLAPEQRAQYVSVYSDSEAVRQNAADISWAVENIPTPFVGSAPWPGQQQNSVINSLQFRANQDVRMPKPEKTVRIFLTGGSTAYGSGAPSQQSTIGAFLEQQLNHDIGPVTQQRYEVYTFANPAWASTHERIAIENLLSELDPDLVISLSGNNDVFWGDAGRNVLWFHTLTDDYFQQLISMAREITGRTPLPMPAANSSRVEPAVVADRLIKNLRLGAFALSLQNVPWVFFLQPTLAVSHKPLTPRESMFLNDDQAYYQACYAAFEQQFRQFQPGNLSVYSLADLFDQWSAEQDVFLDSFHFGDKGNKAIAERMFELIKDQFL